jgi:hypothetical protein
MGRVPDVPGEWRALAHQRGGDCVATAAGGGGVSGLLNRYGKLDALAMVLVWDSRQRQGPGAPRGALSAGSCS